MVTINDQKCDEKESKEREPVFHPALIKELFDCEISASLIIQKIKQGELNPKFLRRKQRIAVVEALRGEYKKVSEIAIFLQRDERTIQRDLAEIEEKQVIISDSPRFITTEIL